jgi:hypothetical protein
VWVDQSVANGLPFDANPCNQFRWVTVSAGEEAAYVAVSNVDGTSACRRALYKRATNGTWSANLVGFQNGTGTTLTDAGWIEPDPPAGLGWGFGGNAQGIAIAPQDPARAVFVNKATVVTTGDGGATWQQAYSSGSQTTGLWKTIGLDVTSAWNYYVNGTTHFIANTDIGLSRSDDGVTWKDIAPSTAGTQWSTVTQQWLNVYAMAFEAGVAQAGEQCAGQTRVWAAVSALHDIPEDKTLDDTAGPNQAGNHGTVLISCDGGVSWSATTMDPDPVLRLPDGPVVSLLYRLENGVKTLYASVWRNGVYVSSGTTIGKTWREVGGPFPFPGTNKHVYQLRENAGSLYVTVTAAISPACTTCTPRTTAAYQPGGLFKLVGSTWTNLTAGNNLGPIDFTFDPSGNVYVATIDTPQFVTGGVYNGGLWKSSAARPVG